MIRGPYALWHHQHTFEPNDSGDVVCADRVIYKIPLGPIGRILHALTVRNQLLDIFRDAADYWGDRKIPFRCFYSFL